MGHHERKQMQETTAHTKVEGKLKQHIFRLSA